MVEKGMCGYDTKAARASKYIHPPGIVKFLIIDGDHHIDEDDQENKTRVVDLQFESLNIEDNSANVWVVEELSGGEGAGSWTDSISSIDVFSRMLRRKKKPDPNEITVSVLHVTYAAGFNIFELLQHELPSERKAGGTNIELTGDIPSNKKQKRRVLWLCLMIIMGMSFFFCLMSTVSSIFEVAPPAHQQGNRPRRRRLAPRQVRRNFPVGVFDGRQVNFPLLKKDHGDLESEDIEGINNNKESATPLRSTAGQEETSVVPNPLVLTDETCTICLDEYVVGDKLRSLPCQHTFHSKCISKWLTERSATCPLCKIDLYESDDEDEETPAHLTTLSSSWNSVPPEAQEAPTQPQQETQSAGATPSEPTGVRWQRRGRALGAWGRSLFRRRNSPPQPTEGNASTPLTEPLLPEGSHEDVPEQGEGAFEATNLRPADQALQDEPTGTCSNENPGQTDSAQVEIV